LKAFLESQKEFWLNKQKEVEKRFLDLKNSQSPFQEPKRKKRKRYGKEPPTIPSDESFAKFAAELQIEFFVKVKTSNQLIFVVHLLQVHAHIITALII